MRQPFEGLLEQLQDHVYDVLRTKNEFKPLYIVKQKRSSLEFFCEQLQEQGIGEGILITPPLPKKIVEQVPGPVYEQIDFSIKVIENIVTNESGVSSIFVAEMVTHLLHLYTCECGGQRWEITCQAKSPWEFQEDLYKNVITVFFQTRGSF